VIHRVMLRRAASLACAVTLTAVTAACSGLSHRQDAKPRKGDAAQRTAEGVVSTRKAASLLDHYVSVNNQANKRQDGKLLSTVEGGALLEQSKADYAQFKLASAKEKAEYGDPFFYVDRRYYIPRKGTASWFAVSARTKDDEGKSENPVVLIFDREDDASWKLVASVRAPKGRDLAPAMDKDGFLQTVPESTKRGGTAPDQLKYALTSLYTKPDVSAAGFKSSKVARDLNKTARDAAEGVGEGGTMHWMDGGTQHTKTYAMRTRSGQTFVVFNAPVDRTVRITRPGYTVTPNEVEQVYVGEDGAPGFLTNYLHQSSAVIPDSGKPTLLSTESRLIDCERETGF